MAKLKCSEWQKKNGAIFPSFKEGNIVSYAADVQPQKPKEFH